MKRPGFKSILILFLLIAGLLWALLGEKGLVQLYKVSSERERAQKFNEALKAENEALRREINRLKGDEDYLGRVARKELGLVGKDEVVYQFEE